MSWLSRLFARAKSKEEAPGRSFYFGGHTQAGVHVTPDSALKSAAVWACIHYLSRTVAQLPWHVHQPNRAGGSEVAGLHPVDWLLNQRPCPDMGSFSWRQTAMGHVLMRGNAYAEIERDMRGMPVALWPLHPDRVEVRRDEQGALFYRVANGGGYVDLDAMDVFHVRGFGDGAVGYNVIDYAAQSVGLAQATEIFGAAFFGNGMNPTGVVEVAKGMTPDALKELRNSLREMYAGPGKRQPAILDAGMKWQRVSVAPDESQFIETRWHQVEEVCRWFGVPPHKIQHLLRSTFSNIENQAIEVVVDTITPWVKVFEEEANYKLFGQNRQGLFTKMNLNGLLRGDSASRATFYKNMREMGVLSVNEIRMLEDMNPIGPEGDKRLCPMNMTTLDKVGEEPGSTEPVDDAQAFGAQARRNGRALPN